MDIKDTTLEFGLAHDEVKERNRQLEKETEDFGKEADLHISRIELDVQKHIGEMSSELDALVNDMQKALREQTQEFQQDVEWDLMGLEKEDDPAHEFKTDARELKKEFTSDISGMQEELRANLESLTEKVDTRIDIIRDLSELELSMAIDDIIQQAKNDELPVDEEK